MTYTFAYQTHSDKNHIYFQFLQECVSDNTPIHFGLTIELSRHKQGELRRYILCTGCSNLPRHKANTLVDSTAHSLRDLVKSILL